ncbi:MAG: hypothetical protein GMKNLPBB_01154 [Myxococcota bacterium]|nr:hypothetical protein [Myxococcota bacterium]
MAALALGIAGLFTGFADALLFVARNASLNWLLYAGAEHTPWLLLAVTAGALWPALLLGLAAGPLMVSGARISARAPGFPPWLPLASAWLLLLGFGLFSGRRFHAAGQVWIAPAIFGCAAAAILTWRRRRVEQAARKALNGERGPLLLMGISLCFLLIDARLYPGLYPRFHDAMGAAALGCAWWGVWLKLRSEISAMDRRSRAVVAAAPAIALAWSAAFAHMPLLAEGSVETYVLKSHTLLISKFARISRPLLHPAPDARALEFAAGDLERLDFPWLGAGKPPPHVFLITMDAVRADVIGRRHAGRDITPFLSGLKQRAAYFSHSYAVTPYTSGNLFAMTTGAYPPAERGAETPASLFTALARLGYHVYCDHIMHMSYDNRLLRCETLHSHEAAEDILSTFGAYLGGADPEQPLFARIHFNEPHAGYVSHPEFPMGGGDWNNYLSEVAYTDQSVRKLWDMIQDRGFAGNAILIISSDHGEAFGEHGVFFHSSNLYEEQVRVPLWISFPGVAAFESDTPVSSADVAPAVLHMLGQKPLYPGPGASIAARLLGRAMEPRPVWMHYEGWYGVRMGDLKLLHDTRVGSYALFNLARDPGETTNLIEGQAADFARLRGLLDGWRLHVETRSF